MTPNEQAIVDAFRDGYEGSMAELAGRLDVPSREVRAVVVPLVSVGILKRLPKGGFAWNGTPRKKTP